MRYCQPIWVTVLLVVGVIPGVRGTAYGTGLKENEAVAQQFATGLMSLSQHQCQRAAAALEQALADNPDLPEARILLGLAYDCSGDRQKLVAAFNSIWDHDLDAQEPTSEMGLIDGALRAGLELKQRTVEGRYFEALLYLRVGRYGTAVEKLQGLEAPVAGSWAYYNLLGTIHLRQARFSDARQALEVALELSRRHADTFYKLGTIALATGDVSGAITQLRQATTLRPAFPAASAALGMALQQAGKFEAAREALTKGTPVGPEIYVYLGITNERLGDRDAAIKAYTEASTRQSQLLVAQFSLGRLLLEAGRAAEAVTPLRNATQLQPGKAQAHLYLALALIATSQMEAAVTAAQRAKDTSETESADFHDALGEVFQNLDRQNEAQECFQRAVSLDRSKESYFRHLAASQRKAGDDSAAMATLQAGLTDLPASARLHFLLGLLLVDRGSAPEALESLRKACQLEPSNAEYQHSLGLCLATLERDEEAEICFRQAISLNSRYTAAYHQIGLLQLKANAANEAEQTFRKVLEIDAGYAPAYFRLGKIYYDHNDDPEALKLLEKARDLDPNWEDTYFLLGTLYRRTGNPSEAARMFTIFREKKNEVQELRRRTYDKASGTSEQAAPKSVNGR